MTKHPSLTPDPRDNLLRLIGTTHAGSDAVLALEPAFRKAIRDAEQFIENPVYRHSAETAFSALGHIAQHVYAETAMSGVDPSRARAAVELHIVRAFRLAVLAAKTDAPKDADDEVDMFIKLYDLADPGPLPASDAFLKAEREIGFGFTPAKRASPQ